MGSNPTWGLYRKTYIYKKLLGPMEFIKTQEGNQVTIRAVVDDSEVGKAEYSHIPGGIYLYYIEVYESRKRIGKFLWRRGESMRRRGIGKALVQEVLNEGPEFVYAVPKSKSGKALMLDRGFEQAVKGESHYVWGSKEAYNESMQPHR